MQVTRMPENISRLVCDYYAMDLPTVVQNYDKGICGSGELAQYLIEGFRRPDSHVAIVLNKLSLKKRSLLLEDDNFPFLLKSYYSLPEEFTSFLGQAANLKSCLLWHINQVMNVTRESKEVRHESKEIKRHISETVISDEEFWERQSRELILRQWPAPSKAIYDEFCQQYPVELIHALAIKMAIVHLDIFFGTVRPLLEYSGRHLCLNGCSLFLMHDSLDLRGISMPAANLVGARIGNVYDVDWHESDFTKAIFCGSRICGVNFQNTILEEVEFKDNTSSVLIQRCDFVNATISPENKKKLVSLICDSFNRSIKFSDMQVRNTTPYPLDWEIFSEITRLFKRAEVEHDLSKGYGGFLQRVNHLFFKRSEYSLFNFSELVHLLRVTNSKNAKEFLEYINEFPHTLKEKLKNGLSNTVARFRSLENPSEDSGWCVAPKGMTR